MEIAKPSESEGAVMSHAAAGQRTQGRGNGDTSSNRPHVENRVAPESALEQELARVRSKRAKVARQLVELERDAAGEHVARAQPSSASGLADEVHTMEQELLSYRHFLLEQRRQFLLRLKQDSACAPAPAGASSTAASL